MNHQPLLPCSFVYEHWCGYVYITEPVSHRDPILEIAFEWNTDPPRTSSKGRYLVFGDIIECSYKKGTDPDYNAISRRFVLAFWEKEILSRQYLRVDILDAHANRLKERSWPLLLPHGLKLSLFPFSESSLKIDWRNYGNPRVLHESLGKLLSLNRNRKRQK